MTPLDNIPSEEEDKPGFWIKDNRILLGVLFGLSSLIFLLLFIDSHKKAQQSTINTTTAAEQFRSQQKSFFSKALKKRK